MMRMVPWLRPAAAVLAGGLILHGPSLTGAPRTGSAVGAPTDPLTSPTRQALEGDRGTPAQLAAQFLDAVRGASPVACEMIARSLGVGWGWRGAQRAPDAAPEVQSVIRWATEGTRDPAAVPRLRSALTDADGCVRRMAARLLGRTRHPQAVTALTDALTSAQARTRRLAAVGLGYAEERDTVEPLVQALEDSDASVRAAAAWALGELEDREAVPALTRLLASDPDSGVRRSAALALGEILG